MKIKINDNRKIFAVQEEFSEIFPYLKIEFFSKPHTANGPSTKKIIKHSSKTLAECRTIHENGNITITPTMTVSELEQQVSNAYGLGVHLLRKTGNVWLETTLTDAWTLEEQNKNGQELSNLSSDLAK